MAKNAQVSVKIGAQDTGTKPVIDNARQNLDKLGDSAKDNAQKMKVSFDAMKVAAVAGLAVLGNSVKNAVLDYAAATDKLAKDSRAIGVSTESWQQLTYAADRQGVSSEQLYASFKKFGQAMGQIKTGVGGMTTALQKMNPQLLQQLKGAKNNEEAFLMAADAIKAIPDAAERSALAMQIFGKSGVELNKIFEAGSDGIKALMDEQAKYGVVTTEQANQSEAFIDAMTKLKTASQAFANMLFAALIPALTPIIEGIAAWIASNKPLIQFIAKLLGLVVKLSPYLLAGAAAYVATAKAMQLAAKATQIWSTVTRIAAAITAVFNGTLAVNPISLIPIAVAAAVVAIMLLIKHFDKVVAAVKTLGRWIKAVFTPENWVKSFKAIGAGLKQFFLNPLESIKKGFAAIWEFIKKIFGLTKKGQDEMAQSEIEPPPLEETPLMAEEQNAKLNEARYVSESRQSMSVDLNFRNLPKDLMVEQTKAAPNVNIKLGYAGS